MTKEDLIELRGEFERLASDLEAGIDISDLPEGTRLLMLDTADAAEKCEYHLHNAVVALADRDGI